jgi:hypothetical protein
MTAKKNPIRHQENVVGGGVATCGDRDGDGLMAFTPGGAAGVTCKLCKRLIAERCDRENARKKPHPGKMTWVRMEKPKIAPMSLAERKQMVEAFLAKRRAA